MIEPAASGVARRDPAALAGRVELPIIDSAVLRDNPLRDPHLREVPVYLPAGTKDEFHMQFALRILVRELGRLGVPHEHVEHDGGHFGLDHRDLTVVPRLVAALAREG